jgi:hypothetical protein
LVGGRLQSVFEMARPDPSATHIAALRDYLANTHRESGTPLTIQLARDAANGNRLAKRALVILQPSTVSTVEPATLPTAAPVAVSAQSRAKRIATRKAAVGALNVRVKLARPHALL